MRTCLILILLLLSVSSAHAGDAATVVFRSGQVVMVGDGYRQLVDAMKTLDGKSGDFKIVELSIGGGSFLLNMAEVVIVCRDDCRSLIVRHQLDPARSKAE